MISANFTLAARLALAAAFLSAVADRWGLWSIIGSPGVDWGSMEGFYPAVVALNPWLPAHLVPALAWAATLVELALGIFLIVGVWLPPVYLASGVLLTIFGAAMALFTGLKLPLNYSVFSAAACAFLLYAIENAEAGSRARAPHEHAADEARSALEQRAP
ncbi:MAG TPA: hypothetical protein VIF40_19530 [Methylosinus sp.]|jgi:uncharacterized membrane protein YphA (DoxX/SURF4 family)|uniref:hypothetical protein n=1 Tax=Methylosinus sp. TaxID=427 RepID=UPI002F922C09